MSNKWLEQEATKWVKKDIITNEQYEEILKQYPKSERGFGVLPILGSILIGLGILSFIAANWQDIPSLLRLGLIIVVMCGFYFGGAMLERRGQHNTGVALIGIGLLSFGAGIFLVAQMYNLVSNNVFSFLVWAVAGLCLLYLYRSRYLFIITVLILNVAQFYSLLNFGKFSISALLFVLIGLGYDAIRSRDGGLAALTAATLVIQSLAWLFERETSFFWIYLVLASLYVVGELFEKSLRRGVQGVVTVFAFAIATWFAFMDFTFISLESILEGLNLFVFAPVWIVLLLLSASLKWRKSETEGKRTTYSMAHWLLLLPVFLIDRGTDWFYLIVLFGFALFILLDGYHDQVRVKINVGTLAFLFVTFLSYLKLTWDFMDKSFVFISGGCILFGLSWFLNRRRKDVLQNEGGDQQ